MTGNYLKTLLKHYGLNQREAGTLLGLSEMTIGRSIAKENEDVGPKVAKAASEYFIKAAKSQFKESEVKLNELFNQLYYLINIKED